MDITRDDFYDIFARFPELAEHRWRLTQDGRSPRATCGLENGDMGVINVRFARWPNSREFEHWLTIRGGDYNALSARPSGFRFWFLQIGRDPADRPWWAALWREEALAAHLFRAIPRDNGRWYAFCPDDFPVDARPVYVDLTKRHGAITPEELALEYAPIPEPVTPAGRQLVAAQPQTLPLVLEIERSVPRTSCPSSCKCVECRQARNAEAVPLSF